MPVSYTHLDVYKRQEAERLKKYIKDNAYTIALAIDGKQYSSEDFSAHVHDLGLKGESHLQLIIGGSIGLDVYKRQRVFWDCRCAAGGK